MNCAKCKELLVGYIEGLLDESQNRAVAGHLKDCASCRAETAQLNELQDRLVTNGEVLAGSDLEDGVMNQIIREQKTRLKASSEVGRKQNIWRVIMKSRITQLAIAAAIIIVVFIGLHSIGNPFGATVTFAKVIEPILNARTVVLDFIVGSEETGPVMHDIIVGSRIRRTFSNMETILILDLDNAKMLTLGPSDKGAIYMDIKGPLQEGTRSYLGLVRDIVAKIEDNPNIPVQELGEREIDGREAIGFYVSDIELTIWADLETALPIRIELLQGQTQTIIKNIEFDVPVDESLVSMDVPAGYTLNEEEQDWTEFNEQDFIVVLRVWAEYVLGGRFPDNISLEDLMNLTSQLTNMAPRTEDEADQLGMSEEEQAQLGMSFGRGFVFFQQLEPSGADWHYVGKGVEFGDASTAVFLYRPKGSDTYRVIYGDLHVEDSAPEDLPK